MITRILKRRRMPQIGYIEPFPCCTLPECNPPQDSLGLRQLITGSCTGAQERLCKVRGLSRGTDVIILPSLAHLLSSKIQTRLAVDN